LILHKVRIDSKGIKLPDTGALYPEMKTKTALAKARSESLMHFRYFHKKAFVVFAFQQGTEIVGSKIDHTLGESYPMQDKRRGAN
jgi:hypothetical protein